ncbi:hypothetical protein MNB_SV-5-776 [hydrothermal vent metagenome]|uniref:Plasminogen-binding protein PgbA N-terminal domain-containing protein n=1 Tax=hydrothermal vent metagenome TaxID=652676 RepID=A0A1W1ED33_9ZZZZ
MRKIALIALSALPLFAGFFPATVNTSVSNISGNNIKMSSSFPVNGMSGVVVHNYGNNIKAITSRIMQTSKGTAVLKGNDIIHHDKLPTIKTLVAKGDKVIGGYLYNNVLLLAPDANTYSKITASYNKQWIHPDLYAIYLSQEGESMPTKANLAEFAKQYQVGLIYIVKKGSAVLLDPITGKHVGQKAVSGLPAKAQFPFFMRFDKIDSGWFSKSASGTYYNLVESL